MTKADAAALLEIAKANHSPVPSVEAKRLAATYVAIVSRPSANADLCAPAPRGSRRQRRS